MPDLLHLEVPSGIGDFSWLYSKLVGLNAPLDIKVAKSGAARTLPFLKLLPNVAKMGVGRFRSHDVLGAPDRSGWSRLLLEEASSRQYIRIQINTWLEGGMRIEDWMPDLPVDYHYVMRREGQDKVLETLSPWQRWFTFYCANARTVKRWRSWEADEWAELGEKLMEAFPIDGIVLIGAGWDISFTFGIEQALSGKVPCKNVVGELSLGESLEVVRRSAYTIAFPSGIPILAATMGCPVFMFYPHHLEPMQDAWADPQMIEDGSYKGHQFCTPGEVFDWIGNGYGLKERMENP